MSLPAVYYCPGCGEKAFLPIARKKLECRACAFQFYRNAASAVAAVLLYEDEILVGKRGRNPCKGLLDLPGGFVDPGESLEAALFRELYEELGLRLDDANYLGSGSNRYHYANVDYDTTDAFFEIRFGRRPAVTAMDDLEDFVWLNLGEMELDQFAFESQRKLLRQHYLS
ncbi:MAG: NUDIX domain-containing protein [Pseudomonadota bacterium]